MIRLNLIKKETTAFKNEYSRGKGSFFECLTFFSVLARRETVYFPLTAFTEKGTIQTLYYRIKCSLVAITNHV